MNDEINEEMNDEQQSVEPEVEVVADEPTKKINVDIGGWLKYGWELFTADVLKYIVSALIVSVISVVTCGILAGPMLVGFFKCILKKTRGDDFEYGDLFDGVSTQFLPAFLLMVVASASVFIASVILTFIPIIGQLATFIISSSVALIANYMYLQMAEMDETVEVGKLVDMAKASFNRMKSEYIMFMVWALVIYIIGMIGAVICLIGVLFTWPISLIAVTKSYFDVIKTGDEVTVVAEEVVEENI